MYRSWHFAADRDGCSSLVQLLALLSDEVPPVHRTLTVVDPRTVGADRIFGPHDLKLDVPTKLRLCTLRDPQTASIDLNGDVGTLSLSASDLMHFTRAVTDVSQATADFGVGFGQDIMTFWWCPKGR